MGDELFYYAAFLYSSSDFEKIIRPRTLILLPLFLQKMIETSSNDV